MSAREIFLRKWQWTLAATVALASSVPGILLAQGPASPPHAPVERSVPDIQSRAEAELQKGIELTRGGHFAEAIPHFLAARGHVSNEYAAEFNLALCYVGTGQAGEAIGILSELRRNGHENASVENLLAQAFAKDGHSNEAFEALHRSADLAPADEKLYLYVADAFLERREPPSSLSAVELGLKNLPNSARLHYERGYLLGVLDESDSAKAEYERAAALGPRSEIGYLAVAQKNLLTGDISQTIQAARAGIREGHTDYQLLAVLGEGLLRTGARPGDAEFTEARSALEKSIAVKPNYASTQISLGHLYLLEGGLDRAIEHLELGLQLDPQNLSVYPLLAQAYRRLGQPEKAEAALAILARMNQEQAQKIRTAPGDSKAIPGAARPDRNERRP